MATTEKIMFSSAINSTTSDFNGSTTHFRPKDSVEEAAYLEFDPPLEHVTMIDFRDARSNASNTRVVLRSMSSSRSNTLRVQFFNGTTIVGYKFLSFPAATSRFTYENNISIGTLDFFVELPKVTVTKIAMWVLDGYYDTKGVYSTLNSNYSSFLLTTEPPPLLLQTRAINVVATIAGVDGASGYRLTYEVENGEEVDVVTDTSETVHNIASLLPETTYTLRLYVDTGSGYELTDTVSTTTLSNQVSNYVRDDFFVGKKYRIRQVTSAEKSFMYENIDKIFNTGDKLNIGTKNNRDVDAIFVNRGETASFGKSDNLLLPFVEIEGSGQAVNLLVDEGNATVSVEFNDTENSIVVDSTEYRVGDKFVLDGKTCVVADLSED